jgi:hypothetical protein
MAQGSNCEMYFTWSLFYIFPILSYIKGYCASFIFNSIGNIKLYNDFYYYKENKKKRFKHYGIYNYSAEPNKLAGEGGG